MKIKEIHIKRFRGIEDQMISVIHTISYIKHYALQTKDIAYRFCYYLPTLARAHDC